MFNWLGNLFPYSDLHSLNLDWLLSKMKETATQAAQAVADSAKALAQVIEAKTAAQNAQTAAQNAQTAANNAQTAANNAADSAENAVAEAQAAQTAAQNAQNTANTAQTAAQNAQNTANTAINKFPIKTEDITNNAVTNEKISTNISGNKISKRSIKADAIAFETIQAGFVSYPAVNNINLKTISNSEIEFYFPIASSFVDSTAAFVRLVKPEIPSIGNGKTYIVTSPFPASQKSGKATFNCERYLTIGDIFDENDNLIGTCIIDAITSYGRKDDGSNGWSGKLKLLYCDTGTDFSNMNGELGVSSVKLTNIV